MLSKTTAIAGLLMCVCFAANADEPNPLIGKWAEKFKNGNMMITEFTDTSIISTPVNKAGKPQAKPNVADISYRTLGKDEKLGDEYSIDFKAADGTKRGGFLVFLKDPDTLLLDFPDMGMHKTHRYNP